MDGNDEKDALKSLDEINEEKKKEKEDAPPKSLEEAMHDGKGEDNLLKTFPKSVGITTAKADELILQYGKNELPEKVTPKWLVFLKLLWPFTNRKAGNATAALKASLKPTAIVMRDGKWNHGFDARFLVPGDLIELAAGDAVPADCMVNQGSIDVDESALTGESLPVTLHEGEMAKMGDTVARGKTQATVILTGKNTFFGKTASLL